MNGIIYLNYTILDVGEAPNMNTGVDINNM
jgi:hypothetical protein